MDNNDFSKPSSFAANPYAASGAVSDLPLSEDKAASRLTRLLATIIDGLFILVPFFIFGFIAAVIAGASMSALKRGDFAANGMLAIVLMGLILLSWLVVLIVQLVLIARYAQTVGKRIMKIRVVRFSSGEQCGLGRYFWMRIVVPALLQMIPFLGFIFWIADPLFIFAHDRRCLHDHLADTKVVEV